MPLLFRWIRCGLTALACLVGAACVAAQSQDPPATFAVHGVVRNSITHQPIARVLVDAQQDAALTDNEGRFELNLPAEQVTMTLRRPGYVPHSRFNSVQVGENMPEISLSLTPLGKIEGHISGSTGEDAEGIRLIAYRQITRHGHHAWQMQGNAMSDSEGRFHFVNLTAPASYLLAADASADLSRPQNAAKTFGYGPAFYPDGSETSATNLLVVTPGQQSSVEMSLTREAFYAVAIQVRSAAEAKGFSVQVHDASGLAGDFPTEFVGDRHMLTTRLPAGRYSAEVRTYGGIESYGRIDFAVKGGPLRGLSMECLPLSPVLVRVRKEFTADPGVSTHTLSVDGQGNVSQPPDPGMNLTLVSRDGLGQTPGGLLPAANSEGGTLFQMQGAIPGTYWATANAWQGYIRSLTSGGVDLATEPITIGPGNTTAPIEAVLRNDGGAIQGTVRLSPQQNTGRGVGGNTFLYAIPLFASSSPPSASGMVANGNFTISNLAPGSYRVVAFDSPVELETLEPDELARYMSKGETVSVEPSGTATVSLDSVTLTGSGEGVE